MLYCTYYVTIKSGFDKKELLYLLTIHAIRGQDSQLLFVDVTFVTFQVQSDCLFLSANVALYRM